MARSKVNKSAQHARYGGTPPYARFVLDSLDTDNLLLACSLYRRLLSSYTGAAFRVRRASDSAEQDVEYLANGFADEAAITSFCSGTDGFVVTAYDQSGNGNDLTQATVADQPKIHDSSTGLVKMGGKLAAYFTSASLFRTTSLGLGGSDPALDMFHAAELDIAATIGFFQIGNIAPYHRHQYDLGDKSLRHGDGARIFDGAIDETAPHVVSSRVESGYTYGEHRMWANMTELSEKSVSNATNTLSPLSSGLTLWGIAGEMEVILSSECMMFGATSGSALSIADADTLRSDMVDTYA